MTLFPRVSVSTLLSLPLLSSSLLAKGEGPASYVVLTVTTMEGKVTYKPIAEKDRVPFQKSLDEEYQKAKKSYQEEKKAAEKQKGTFEKPEPAKPKILVTKRDLKTFNEARKVAYDLERELEQKGKNGKKNGNGNGGEKNGKDTKKPTGKT